jgi:hypothetical protein
MLDGNGESCPPSRGHKLGKKENIREILWEQGGHNLEEEHAWAALSEREYSTLPVKKYIL